MSRTSSLTVTRRRAMRSEHVATSSQASSVAFIARLLFEPFIAAGSDERIGKIGQLYGFHFPYQLAERADRFRKDRCISAIELKAEKLLSGFPNPKDVHDAPSYSPLLTPTMPRLSAAKVWACSIRSSS